MATFSKVCRPLGSMSRHEAHCLNFCRSTALAFPRKALPLWPNFSGWRGYPYGPCLVSSGSFLTSLSAGSFVIQEKTISRKHLTIEVAPVAEGDGVCTRANPKLERHSGPEFTSSQMNLQKRSLVTIEDLKTKIGTLVNGKQIKGERFDLVKDTNEIKLGHYQETFR